MGQPDLRTDLHVARRTAQPRPAGVDAPVHRLTNAFSKKLEFHLYVVALHTMHHNLCKAHGPLTEAAGGVKTTPAMAAGPADRPRSVEDLLEFTDPLPREPRP